MRRLLRILLWLIKAPLLILALAALVMWPLSRSRELWLSAERYTMHPAWGERRVYITYCRDGHAVIGGYQWHASGGDWLNSVRQEARTGGERWRWNRGSRPHTWNDAAWPGRWGPLRWALPREKDPGLTITGRWYAAPLWLIALLAGVWPLTSIALAIRRHRIQRRATREGLCEHCSYDLRATPDKSGVLLPICPECGREVARASRP